MSRRPAAVDVSVEARDFMDLVNETKRFSPALATAMRRNLRQAGGIAAKAAQESIRSAPVKGKQHTGLREGIASGIGVQVSTSSTASRVGVSVVSTGKGLPVGQKRLIRSMNRTTFRHPVFGNRTSWVVQQGHPYFDRVIAAKEPIVRKAIDDAIDEATRAMGAR